MTEQELIFTPIVKCRPYVYLWGKHPLASEKSIGIEQLEQYPNLSFEQDEDGIFLFSQEHPLATCYNGNAYRWTRDENGNKLYANISDYCVEGKKDSTWFVEHVQIYHRMFSTIVNTLADSGFRIIKMKDPYPTEEIVQKYPEYADLYHKPDFLFIKSVKV